MQFYSDTHKTTENGYLWIMELWLIFLVELFFFTKFVIMSLYYLCNKEEKLKFKVSIALDTRFTNKNYFFS